MWDMRTHIEVTSTDLTRKVGSSDRTDRSRKQEVQSPICHKGVSPDRFNEDMIQPTEECGCVMS